MMYLIVTALICIYVASSTVRPEAFTNRTTAENKTASKISYSQYSEEFLSCGKFSLEAQHYQLFENGSVHVPIYKTMFDPGNYFLSNGTLYVCPPPATKHRPSYSNATKDILTDICLTLSCICLGLHLLIFIIVPEYKTLSGRNTASIAACLFIAYALFLVAGRFQGTIHCSRIAIATRYFFLCSFFWMNSFAFEVWLSLNTTISKLHEFIIRTKESTRYLIYAVYSFGVPSVFVGTAVTIDRAIMDSIEFDQGFNATSCWFQSYVPFIAFFIAPFVTLILLDLLFFVLSVVAVTRLKVSNGKHELSPKRRLILCLRLAVATGLPWVVGIFAMFINWDPLWKTFTLCTALQGVYILLAYNCNKKTLKYLLRTFKGKQESSPTTSVVKNASTPV